MNLNKKLIIIGASGHGKTVVDIALKLDKWSNIYFLDDNEFIGPVMGIDVIDKSFNYKRYVPECDFFIAIGDNKVRKFFYERLKELNASIVSLIHPSVILGNYVSINEGTCIMAGAIINSCTNIGSCCIINTGVTIDHDNVINSFVHISPGSHLAGNVTVGETSWIGIGTSIINNVSIADESIIGAGSLVLNNIEKSGIYVGVPVKSIKNEV